MSTAERRFGHLRRGVTIGRLRRLSMAAIFALFLLQYARIDLLVGSLSGSIFLGTVKLLDIFAFLESGAAARGVDVGAVVAVLPVVLLYVVFGRAFCGWVCPMDFLFRLAARGSKRKPLPLSPRFGYTVAGAFLIAAAATGTPFFTSHLSHLTNLFRALAGAVTVALPGSLSILLYSAALLGALLILERLFPRLWCRVLCPVGKSYGLFNRVSLLRLRFSETGCSGCGRCEQVCTMGVPVVGHIEERQLRHADCIYCGRCVEACGEGTLRLGFTGRRCAAPGKRVDAA